MFARKLIFSATAAAAVLGAAGPGVPSAVGHAQAAEVNIYSYRQEHLIRPLLDAFTRETGIGVNLVTGGGDALLARLKREGANSPADILLTVDAGRLIRAREAGVLQGVRSKVLESVVPAQYRNPDGYWFGLSVRARVVFYAKGRVDPSTLSTYAALADPKWKGRICVRSSNSVYNQSLLASLIAQLGPQKAEQWARGIVANMARKPQGGDRDQLRAAAAGQCDLAIANTYYYAGMLKSSQKSDREAAGKLAIFWPNQDGRGAHVNISGGAVTRAAPNKAEAVKLLEFLVGKEAQKIYADTVNEYPIRPDVKASATVAGLGRFRADTLPLATFAEHQREAVRIFDRAGWR